MDDRNKKWALESEEMDLAIEHAIRDLEQNINSVEKKLREKMGQESDVLSSVLMDEDEWE